MHPCLNLHQVFILPGEKGHHARGGGECARQTVNAGDEALKVGIVIGEDTGLLAQVSQRVRELRSLLGHLPVLLGVLLTVQTHFCHFVLKLAQLTRQALVAFLVLFLLCRQPGKNALLLGKGALRGLQFRQGGGLRIAGSGFLVSLLQGAHVCLHLLHVGFLLRYLIGKALARRCRLVLRNGYLAVFLLQLRHALFGLLVFLLQLLQRACFLGKDFLACADFCDQLLLACTRLHRLKLALHLVQVGVHTVNHLALLGYLVVDDERRAAGCAKQLLDAHLALVKSRRQVVTHQKLYLYRFHSLLF